MKILKEDFQSIHQMLEIINKRPNNTVMRNRHSSETEDEAFTLTESWGQAMELFQYGYTDILEEIKAGMKENANFQKIINRRKIKTAVQGVAPHVPNAIIGLPHSMIAIESAVQKTKAVSLVYAETASGSVSPSKFIQSGIAILSTVHALEIRGFRVNLKVMFFNGTSSGEGAFGTVNLKHYREHLDLHKLCFPIAHPSMFRRIGFKWLETLPELEEHSWADGYGKPIHTEDLLELEGLKQKNEYYITLEMTEECDYNVDEIIKRLNIA